MSKFKQGARGRTLYAIETLNWTVIYGVCTYVNTFIPTYLYIFTYLRGNRLSREGDTFSLLSQTHLEWRHKKLI